MLRRFLFVLVLFFAPLSAAAQDQAWVQIAARPTSSEAAELAAAYSGSLANVEGYALSSGWFAIALGPFERGEAESVLSRLINSGTVPGDAFVSDGGNYQARIWPVGAPVVAAAPAALGQSAADIGIVVNNAAWNNGTAWTGATEAHITFQRPSWAGQANDQLVLNSHSTRATATGSVLR